MLPAPMHGEGPVRVGRRSRIHGHSSRAGAGVVPRFHDDRTPGPGDAVRHLRAEYVDRATVTHTVVHADGAAGGHRRSARTRARMRHTRTGRRPSPYPAPRDQLNRRVPLGIFVGPQRRQGRRREPRALGRPRRVSRVRRSGDLAVQADHGEEDPRTRPGGSGPRRRRLQPAQPAARSTSLIRGLLGDGVAASTRFDPQAKALGEWVRSRNVDVPEDLL